MFIAGLGVAAPPQRYTQRECWDALQKSAPFARLAPRSRAILKKVLCGDNGIATRHLALEPLSEAFNLTPDALHARFARHAPALATEAAQRALQDAAAQPTKLTRCSSAPAPVICVPGLTSYVSERLGLRADIFTLDLVGQGCGAALPNLRTAEAFLAAGRAEKSCPSALRFAARRFISMTIPACSSARACSATARARRC